MHVYSATFPFPDHSDAVGYPYNVLAGFVALAGTRHITYRISYEG